MSPRSGTTKPALPADEEISVCGCGWQQKAPDDAEPPIEIDHVVIVCNGCRAHRYVYPDAPLVGADEIKGWIETQLPAYACSCGAERCELRMHIRGAT